LIQAIAAHVGNAPAANVPKSDAMENLPGTEDPPMVSQFADDEEIAEILGGFVGRLAGQIDAMHAAHESGQHDDLRRLAHKLKGAGGSYGYPRLTEACSTLEDAAKASNKHAEAAALEAVAALVRAIQRGHLEYSRAEGANNENLDR
jgi:histidine phosphotransfer protein HptB